MPRVSIVIPCYNQGAFVDEAIESVFAQTWQDFEIIVVNDGSTDPFTVKHLQQLNSPKTRVLHTDNQGLSSARNNGIRESQGEYILPLDADDCIGSAYLEQAVQLLDADPDVGIVYCKARFFGDRNSEWQLPEYSLEEMLLNNAIDPLIHYCKAGWKEKTANLMPHLTRNNIKRLGLVLTSAKFISLADTQYGKATRSTRCKQVRTLFRQGGRT
jgi:glycosyltransferase involved in cell wall biosynthesis